MQSGPPPPPTFAQGSDLNTESKPPTRPSSGEGGSELEGPGVPTTAGQAIVVPSAPPLALGGTVASGMATVGGSPTARNTSSTGRTSGRVSSPKMTEREKQRQHADSVQRVGFTRKSNTWYHFPSAGSKPKGRIGHTLISNEDKAYVYGGTNDSVNSSSAVYFGDLHSYDIRTKEWTEIELTGAVQKARAFHTAVFYNNCMWVFGGCNGRGRFNKLFSIDRYGNTVLIQPRNSPPSSRYCHSAVVFEDRMYVFAGKSGGRNSNCRLSDLTYYDFQRNEWQVCTQNGTIPQSRSAHACFVYGTSMLVFGGRNSEGECCEDLHEYNFHGSFWRSIDLDCSAFGRARHSITLHNGRIIVFGGWNGRKKLNDLFFFSLDTFHFENPDGAEEPPSRRECHTATVIGNTMIVFGGRFHGEFMTDVSELDLNPKSLKDSCRDWLLEAGAQFHQDPNQEMPQLLVKYFSETEHHRARLWATASADSTAGQGVAAARIRPSAPVPPPPFSSLLGPQPGSQPNSPLVAPPGVGGHWAGPPPPAPHSNSSVGAVSPQFPAPATQFPAIGGTSPDAAHASILGPPSVPGVPFGTGGGPLVLGTGQSSPFLAGGGPSFATPAGAPPVAGSSGPGILPPHVLQYQQFQQQQQNQQQRGTGNNGQPPGNWPPQPRQSPPR